MNFVPGEMRGQGWRSQLCREGEFTPHTPLSSLQPGPPYLTSLSSLPYAEAWLSSTSVFYSCCFLCPQCLLHCAWLSLLCSSGLRCHLFHKTFPIHQVGDVTPLQLVQSLDTMRPTKNRKNRSSHEKHAFLCIKCFQLLVAEGSKQPVKLIGIRRTYYSIPCVYVQLLMMGLKP